MTGPIKAAQLADCTCLMLPTHSSLLSSSVAFALSMQGTVHSLEKHGLANVYRCESLPGKLSLIPVHFRECGNVASKETSDSQNEQAGSDSLDSSSASPVLVHEAILNIENLSKCTQQPQGQVLLPNLDSAP